ncbi:peptidase S8/S53 domain-containing protein [Rhexocercosporidium sp. MPI-PUGE-AT-0058]|nr:peptidase S8/S53 domain-containing protein [Rhexocercosporidium sp. MPI-PUGE-AT-0058]
MRFIIAALCLSLVGLCSAANCSQPRPPGSLSASELAGRIQAKLQDICTILTSNPNGTASVQQDGYFLLSTYTLDPDSEEDANDPSEPQLIANNSTLCSAAFNEILDQCVTSQAFFGGQFILFEQTYNLTNAKFPLDPYTRPPTSPQPATTTLLFPSSTIGATSGTPTSTPVVPAIAADISVANAAIAALLLDPSSAILATLASEAINTALFAAEVAFTLTAAGPLLVALTDLVEQLLRTSQAASTAIAFPGLVSVVALKAAFSGVGALVSLAATAENGAPQSTQATPTTTSSTTSACSASTVSSCEVTTICPSPASAAAQGLPASCTTTSTCVQVTGCAVTATTTQTCVNPILRRATGATGESCAVPTAEPYIIYPRDGTDNEQTTSIAQGFLSLNVPLGPPFYTSRSSQDLGVSFWHAMLTPDQVAEFRRNINVLIVISGSNPREPRRRIRSSDLSKYSEQLPRAHWTDPSNLVLDLDQKSSGLGKRGIAQQSAAVDELRLVSQPPGFNLDELGKSYTYNDTTVSGTKSQTLYSLDRGADLNNAEFVDIAESAEWLYPGPSPADSPGDAPTFRDNTGGATGAHGSCMLSKMAGAQWGIARRAKPVLTRVVRTALPEIWLDGLQMIYDHIIANDNQGKAIVSMAISIQHYYVTEAWVRRFSFILQQLVLQGVFIVTGAGNSGFLVPVNGYPALLSDPDHRVAVPQILTVGAVTNTGAPHEKSQTAPWVKVMAPGVNIHCAASDGGAKTRSSGTSDGNHALVILSKDLLQF